MTDLVLTSEQNWAARSHRELYDAVHQGNDPGRSGALGWRWEQFGAGLGESAEAIDRGITATEAGWTGVAADAARAAIRLMAGWVTETARNATEVGARIQEQSRIMAAARAAMPEPVEFDWDAATGTLSGPGIAGFTASAADVRAANDKARAAHEQAVAVMTEMERQSRAVDAGTPGFTAPFDPTTGQAAEVAPAVARAGGAGLSRAALAAADTGESGALPARPAEATPATPHAGDTALSRTALAAAADTGEAGVLPARPAEAAPATLRAGDTALSRTALAADTGESGALPARPTDVPGHTEEMVAAAAGVPVEPLGVPGSPEGPAGPGSVSGPGGVAAAAAVGAGAGAFAMRGAGRTEDSGDRVRSGGVPGASSGAAAAQGTGQAASPHAVAPHQGSGPAGGPLPGGLGAGTGGLGGVRGRGGGRQDGDTELRPGRSTGATELPDGPGSFGPNASGVVGAHRDAGMPMVPGMPLSPGEEDTERRTAYVQREDLFEVPGDELPPSVIGGRKKDNPS